MGIMPRFSYGWGKSKHVNERGEQRRPHRLFGKNPQSQGNKSQDEKHRINGNDFDGWFLNEPKYKHTAAHEPGCQGY